MKATKVYLENGLDVPLYVTVNVASGELEITLHRQPLGKVETVPPGKAAIYRVNDALRRCFRDGKLQYVIHNKTGRTISFTGGREKMKDGPILKIEPLLN